MKLPIHYEEEADYYGDDNLELISDNGEQLGEIFDIEDAEYIVKAVNEYETLKQEIEELKEKNKRVWRQKHETVVENGELEKENTILQQQLDKAVEILNKVVESSEELLTYEFLLDNEYMIDQFLQEVKEG